MAKKTTDAKGVEDTKPEKPSVPQKKYHTGIWLVIALVITILTFVFVPLFYAVIPFVLFFFPWIVFLLIKLKIRTFWKSFLLSSLVSFLILAFALGIFSYLLWNDAQAIKNEIDHQPKYLLYESNNKIQFGIDLTSILQTQPAQLSGSIDTFQLLPPEKLQEIIAAQKAHANNIVIITLEKETLNTLPEQIPIKLLEQPVNVSKEDILAVLDGADPHPLLTKIVGNEALAAQLPFTNDQIRMLMLMTLLQQFASKPPITLYKEAQQNHILYYPNHLLITLIKQIPAGLIEKVLTNLIAVPALKEPALQKM